MKIKVKKFMFIAKIAQKIACLTACLAFSASAAPVATVGEAAFVTVTGIAGFADRKFDSFAEAYAAIKPTIEGFGFGRGKRDGGCVRRALHVG